VDFSREFLDDGHQQEREKHCSVTVVISSNLMWKSRSSSIA